MGKSPSQFMDASFKSKILYSIISGMVFIALSFFRLYGIMFAIGVFLVFLTSYITRNESINFDHRPVLLLVGFLIISFSFTLLYLLSLYSLDSSMIILWGLMLLIMTVFGAIYFILWSLGYFNGTQL